VAPSPPPEVIAVGLMSLAEGLGVALTRSTSIAHQSQVQVSGARLVRWLRPVHPPPKKSTPTAESATTIDNELQAVQFGLSPSKCLRAPPSGRRKTAIHAPHAMRQFDSCRPHTTHECHVLDQTVGVIPAPLNCIKGFYLYPDDYFYFRKILFLLITSRC